MKLISRIILVTILTAGLIFGLSPTSTSQTMAQVSCPNASTSTKRITLQAGLLTVKDQPTDPASNRFSTTDKCIVGNLAEIYTIFIKGYDTIRSIYYTQSKFSDKVELVGDKTSADINLAGGSSPVGRLYHITGNLVINTNFTSVLNAKIGVIFVDGNLTVNTITQLTHTGNIGLVLVVGGNVNIAKTVTRIDGVIITSGKFCSGWDGSLCPVDTIAPQLVINGSVIFLNNPPSPTPTPGKPQFVRKLTTDNFTTPAEVINYQPKYLVILKDIFSRDITVWKEIY